MRYYNPHLDVDVDVEDGKYYPPANAKERKALIDASWDEYYRERREIERFRQWGLFVISAGILIAIGVFGVLANL